MSSSPNLTDPNHSLDRAKNYKRVVFQQGKPILDVDLNDLSLALESQSLSALTQSMGYGPSQTDYREWAVIPCNDNPQSSFNDDNFCLTLGKLGTLKGVVDTTNVSSDIYRTAIPYDAMNSAFFLSNVSPERNFNYLFSGTITSRAGQVFGDNTKDFVGGLGAHRLLAYDESLTINPKSPSLNPTADLDQSFTAKPFSARITEGACRVVFSGFDSGTSYEITGVSNGQLTLSGNVPLGVGVGSSYIILPPNTLTDYRSIYNNTTTQDLSKAEGLSGTPKLVTYVQVFEEDISAGEDPDIQSATLGFETTRRTALRWCVRVAMLRMSKDGDSVGGEDQAPLGLEHIQSYLEDSRLLEYRGLTDATDGTDSSNLTSFWQQRDSNNAARSNTLGTQDSPYTDSFGLSPSHFFSKSELALDNLFWSFLKVVFIRLGGNTGFNDFVLLNMFNSESKSNAADLAQESLSSKFYPALQTDTSATPIVHAFLSTGSSHQVLDGDTGSTPAFFKSPPRVFHTQAELSVDNLQSRSLQGVRGGLIYGEDAPLVFESVAKHLGFIDQALLGLSGLGSAQGATREGHRIPAAVNFTLENTTTGLAQAGYGVGAIKPLNPLASSEEVTGFLGGSSSYKLREKGTRSSHTVNYDDADLGWSFYAKQSSDLVDSATTRSNFSVRSWDEGPAQAASFLRGINFRKLAIKTTAHKEMDLFTISEAPSKSNNQLDSLESREPSATAFQIPYRQSLENNGSLFLESYGGAATDVSNVLYAGETVALNTPSSVFNTSNTIPLLRQYLPDGGVRDFNSSPTLAPLGVPVHRNHSAYFGAWNRFSKLTATLATDFESNTDRPVFTSDLMENRCTAMRLRYHVGDFYPAENDARGVPRNLLVDSMNLYVKVEPLSLAHWMTMPKHQHSILENSISFAEGIEALLKVAHGIGDTQKLLNSSGQALVQSGSPVLTDESLTTLNLNTGDVDPLNLPFTHEKHPFVHWYHPAMHKVKSPLPSGTTDEYTDSLGNGFKITPYPKWGRRSLIVPALVPSTLGIATLTGNNDDIAQDNDYQIPYVSKRTPSGSGSYEDALTGQISDTPVPKQTIELDISGATDAYDTSSFFYPYHGSIPFGSSGTTTYTTDNNQTIEARNNQITFPATSTEGDSLVSGPVFLPASRMYAKQAGSDTEAQVGFNPLMSDFSTSYWDDVSSNEATFPYDERFMHYSLEAGGYGEVPTEHQYEFASWSVPVMRAAISTKTVAGVVDLVRTSFDTGIQDLALSSDYSFTMPSDVVSNWDDFTGIVPRSYQQAQIPTVGPDHNVDTLFVGDLGTALGGFIDRSGFLSPLTLGVPMRRNKGVMPNDGANIDEDVRDSFELSRVSMDQNSPLLASFNAINDMGLQQKLMWNCSFRVLHSRPSGMGNGKSTAPKSITEAFLVTDRVNDTIKPLNYAPDRADRKPFIHLLSTHPATPNSFPNKDNLSHLYSMVSDSTGGSHATGTEDATTQKTTFDYTEALVKTSSMGDTYAADPFDYNVNQAYLGSNNPTRAHDLLESNSGIEIDLLSELTSIHADPTTYGLDTVGTVSGTDLKLIDMMPTANELTLAGDHELIFVLYTSHYGAKMFDDNDIVEADHLPPVAGCHLSATLEINRPSDRISSTAGNEHHYGVVVEGEPLNTYSIPATK